MRHRPPALLLAALLAGCAQPEPAPRRSGFDDMSPALQRLQHDDAQNPGLLAVLDGAALWDEAAGPQGLRCSACHGEARASMRGVAPRYPRFDPGAGRPVSLGQRIAQCRLRQGLGAPGPEDRGRLALEAFVAFQSRGLPLAPDPDPRLTPWRERGRALYTRRLGQLNLACTQCHDTLAGGRLGGSLIPQGHPTGYPVYRLEWQALGSLQRRLRGCLAGVRAEPFAADAPEWVELELHLVQRAAGMPLETPAVRP